jgi:hypothetical protein
MTEIGLKADRQLSDQRVRKAERQLSAHNKTHMARHDDLHVFRAINRAK